MIKIKEEKMIIIVIFENFKLIYKEIYYGNYYYEDYFYIYGKLCLLILKVV